MCGDRQRTIDHCKQLQLQLSITSNILSPRKRTAQGTRGYCLLPCLALPCSALPCIALSFFAICWSQPLHGVVLVVPSTWKSCVRFCRGLLDDVYSHGSIHVRSSLQVLCCAVLCCIAHHGCVALRSSSPLPIVFEPLMRSVKTALPARALLRLCYGQWEGGCIASCLYLTLLGIFVAAWGCAWGCVGEDSGACNGKDACSVRERGCCCSSPCWDSLTRLCGAFERVAFGVRRLAVG